MPDEVISDTSPIQYLHQVGWLDLLPRLYGSIIVPDGVAAELAVGRTLGVALPDLVKLDWIQVRSPPHRGVLPLSVDLGRGEREVLSLAVGRPGVLALLDDALARRFARHLEVPISGTLGVLLKAKTAGYLEAVRPILDRLQSLGFWLDSTTRAAVLEIADSYRYREIYELQFPGREMKVFFTNSWHRAPDLRDLEGLLGKDLGTQR